MRDKLIFIVGAGAGYVLGTKAGQERYQEIKTQAKKIWSDPKTQSNLEHARDNLKAELPVIKDKVQTKVGTVKDKVAQAKDDTGDTLETVENLKDDTIIQTGALVEEVRQGGEDDDSATISTGAARTTKVT